MLEFLKRSASQQALEHLRREERLSQRKFTYLESLRKLADEEEIQKAHFQSDNYYAPHTSTGIADSTNLAQPALNYFYEEFHNPEGPYEDDLDPDIEQQIYNTDDGYTINEYDASDYEDELQEDFTHQLNDLDNDHMHQLDQDNEYIDGIDAQQQLYQMGMEMPEPNDQDHHTEDEDEL